MSETARRNQEASLSKTDRALTALGEGSPTSKSPGGKNKPVTVAKPAAPKKETVGTGTDNSAENARRINKAKRDKLALVLKNLADARATKNDGLANRLAAVAAKMQESVEKISGDK